MPPPTDAQPSEETNESPAASGAGPDPPDPAPITYQRKYTRCHKPTCRRCAEGPGHGPYWYAFWWEDGRTHSRYLGKVAPAATEGTTPLASLSLDTVPVPDQGIMAPPSLRVITLGRFAVERDGTTLPETAWSRRTAVALVKFLLSAPDRRQTRDQVLDGLWPDEDPATARAALYGATHGVRRALDLSLSHSALRVSGGVLALAGSATLWLDADWFAAAAAEALAGHDIEPCRAALAYYGGDYLPDDLYEDWAEHRREELAALRISVLLHQARLCGEGGDLAEARAALAAVLAADPAREDAAIRLMTLLAAAGDRGEALRVYEKLGAALQEQLGVAPSDEVTALAKRLREQHEARAAHRAAPPVEPTRHSNLPAALSTFVGREGARESIRYALEEGRLVTLIGPGGSGKTRIALRVGESMLDRYPDGVWLCELAGLAPSNRRVGTETAPDPVAGALANALGLLEDPACSLERTLVAFLEPRRALLVVDNCEHVLDSAAQLVASLLGSCGGVTVLATSREALGLTGEMVWTVPPLSLPDPARPRAPASLEAYDAIRLFIERARDRRPSFVLDETTAPLVLEVCRRLDGIPLAIELAAARLAFLSLEDLAARLDDRFRLLVGGSRVVLPRQQTLRAAMDWSFGLLGENERTLLLRLTVFVGGWTLAAAEGICADPELPPEIILDTLGGLVAKSLVTMRVEGESARYGILETVRQYGQLKLAEDPEHPAPRARHLAWLAQHCEDMIAGWNAADQASLLRRLDADLDNIRAAMTWGLGPEGDCVEALRLASALSRYWTTRGLVSEGRRWTERALAAAPRAPAELRAPALNRCAILARTEGDNVAADAFWEASLALFREVGDTAGIVRVVGNLGMLRYDLGDDVGAMELLTESLAFLRRQGDLGEVARTLQNLGVVHTRRKLYAEAEAAFAEAITIQQTMDDQAGMGDTFLHMAHLARDREHLDRAAELYAASLRIFLLLGNRPRVASALEGLAHVLLRRYTAGVGAQLVLEYSTCLFACSAA
ncbi:MAG TPA: BTAD domain-containing putative transcriptional regulator, partial [Chloroflexota bacterium]|nr:BTAD domain-containing putative transcriptional regulator [Chloroflexota bacterium]